MKILRWLLKAGLIVSGTVVVLVCALLVAMWVADPAVPRNLFFGQPMDAPARVDLAQPQVRVPGRPQDDLPRAVDPQDGVDADFFDPQLFAEAIQYAEDTGSVALLVQQAGVIRYEHYWPGYDVDTQTNPNSMHKPVLALLLGAAIADGYIDGVDSAAANWLVEWQSDARREITLRHLLQMTAGLEIPVFGTWRSARILFGSDLQRGVLGLQSIKPAGTDFQYSNVNSQLLTIVIERATGMPYAEYLAERLWARLGARDAFLWLDRKGGMPRGFCCLYATARDWLRVGEVILGLGERRGERVVPEDYLREMLAPSSMNTNFGFQIWRGSPPGTIRRYNDYTVKAFHSTDFLVDDVYYIDGYGGQRVYIVPSRELIIVRTGVSRADWDDAIIPNAILRAQRLPQVREE